MISTGLPLVIAISNGAHALTAGNGSSRPPGIVATLLFGMAGRQLHPALVGVAFALSLDSLAQQPFSPRGAAASAASAQWRRWRWCSASA